MHSAWRFCPRCGASLQTTPVDGTDRLACTPACGFVHYDNPTPVVAAIVQCEDRDGAVLLARNVAWEPGKFALVTGFLERNEDPAHGVVREVREETALEVIDRSLVGLYPFERKNELLLAYHVRARGEIVLNEELAEYRLIAPEKLKAWEYGTGLAVRDWLAGRGA